MASLLSNLADNFAQILHKGNCIYFKSCLKYPNDAAK